MNTASAPEQTGSLLVNVFKTGGVPAVNVTVPRAQFGTDKSISVYVPAPKPGICKAPVASVVVVYVCGFPNGSL